MVYHNMFDRQNIIPLLLEGVAKGRGSDVNLNVRSAYHVWMMVFFIVFEVVVFIVLQKFIDKELWGNNFFLILFFKH